MITPFGDSTILRFPFRRSLVFSRFCSRVLRRFAGCARKRTVSAGDCLLKSTPVSIRLVVYDAIVGAHLGNGQPRDSRENSLAFCFAVVMVVGHVGSNRHPSI